jgi:hypothetical protein
MGFKLINRDTRFRNLTRKGKVFPYHLAQVAKALEAAEVLFDLRSQVRRQSLQS